MKNARLAVAMLLIVPFALAACSGEPDRAVFADIQELDVRVEALEAAIENAADEIQESPEPADPASSEEVDAAFTLTTGAQDDQLVFIGVEGEIDGIVNPTLAVQPGDTVQITVVNGHAVEHDLRIDEFDVETGPIREEGEQVTIVFTVEADGEYAYYCTVPGHRAAGMEGVLQVGDVSAEPVAGADIVHNPGDLPGPIGDREPELVQIDLVAQEVVGQLADGAAMTYFTFNGQVPGPFLRVRVGDTVELSVTNETESAFIHSIDLHAVNGPGGGAVYTQTEPGETTEFTFQARNPGIYIYHCATPSVAHHIANGMYGLILVEPEGGLPAVDREFYVVQGEIYTEQPYGSEGLLEFSHEKMLDETPEYFVFNGAAGALTSDENALRASVGETVRIFIGVGGPNFTSSFHVIGEIFDRVYPFGSLTSEVLTDVQTISVAPGGAWAVEFMVDMPGTYILVDHALSRLERGLAGYLIVDGEGDAALFHEGPAGP